MRKERLELSRVAPLVPKTSASTSSATFARKIVDIFQRGSIPKALGPESALLRMVPGERIELS